MTLIVNIEVNVIICSKLLLFCFKLLLLMLLLFIANILKERKVIFSSKIIIKVILEIIHKNQVSF